MNKIKKIISVQILGLLLASPIGVVLGQRAYTGDPDASLQLAMNMSANGNREQARDTLRSILTAFPDYTDVKSLLAKTYSWDGDYEEARKQFNRITSEERKHKEVWIAAIKNEIYANNLNIALGLTNKALLYLKEDIDLKQLKSEVEAKLNNETNTLPKGVPGTEQSEFKNTLGVFSSADVFDVVYDPMYYSGIEYIHESGFGKIIPRINYSNRFDIDGLQYELDLYPKFSKTLYGYFNYGYSESEIYPTHRMGGELYANLPKGVEVSLGARYLSFTDSDVTIFTGSAGYYTGNYYFSARPYITPRANNTTGVSGVLTARRYLKDAYNYLGVYGGLGFMPEFRQFRSNSILIAETVLFVSSQQLMMEYQFSIKDQPSLYRIQLGTTRQELVFAPGNYFWALTAGFRYQSRF